MSKFKKNHQFHMERLEDRRLMAGDIEAFFGAPGTLFIREAAGHVGGEQSVQVSLLENGKVRVQGVTTPSNPQGSKVNGSHDPVEFQVSGFMNLDVNLGSGRDLVHVIGLGSQQQNFSRVGNLKIDVASPTDNPNDADLVLVDKATVLGKLDVITGSGRDIVRVDNSFVGNEMTIRAGTANSATTDVDDVLVNGVRVDRSLLITTGENNDVVSVKNMNLPRGDQGGHITIDTGNGADVINVGSVPVVVPVGVQPPVFGPVTAAGGLHVKAGTDAQNDIDNVRIADAFFDQHIVVELGNGNDNLEMVNAFAKKSISLAGQSGDDTMNVREVEALDGFFASMGAGNDLLNMTFVKSQRMTLDGGAGTNDRLSRGQNPGIPSETITGWETINGMPVLQPKQISPKINVNGLPTLQPR